MPKSLVDLFRLFFRSYISGCYLLLTRTQIYPPSATIFELYSRAVITIDSDLLLGAALVKFDQIQGPLVEYQKNKQCNVESAIEELLSQNNLVKIYITASTSLSPRSIYFDEFIAVISQCGLSMLVFFLDRRTPDEQVMAYWRRARILTGKYSKKGKNGGVTTKIVPTLDRYFHIAAH